MHLITFKVYWFFTEIRIYSRIVGVSLCTIHKESDIVVYNSIGIYCYFICVNIYCFYVFFEEWDSQSFMVILSYLEVYSEGLLKFISSIGYSFGS